jgi:cobalt-zinc-cadmium resistance protein CzcA
LIERIIRFSIAHRHLVLVFSFLLIAVCIRWLTLLPIDAVPDVTNRQVQINVKSAGLGPEDMERLVTFPLELAVAGIPKLDTIRSVSQFGLSQVTLVFEDDADIYFVRQLVNERLQEVRDQLPSGVLLEMSPVSTGLGEIYHLRIENAKLDLMQKRTLLDWVVRPQLRTVKGLAEVNTWGGLVRQFQVQVNPDKLQARGLTFQDVVDAVSRGNANGGGGYVIQGAEQENVRSVGLLTNLDDLRQTVIKAEGGVGVTLDQIGEVVEAPMPRQGAITRDGQGEDAVAITLLLIGENGRVVVSRVKDRLRQLESSLPAGSRIIGFLDRTELIQRTLRTALKNLAEGGLLVVVLLFLFLGQLRAGLIVSSAIPLAMLVAIAGMYFFNVSANLMSLGAIDFGLIVDGAVIIVENCVRRLSLEREKMQREMTEAERLDLIAEATVEVRRATQFGEMIIITSYLPILTLQGLEGKMFRPMGLTVVFALLGAMCLSFTVTPALCAFFLKAGHEHEPRILLRLKALYSRYLDWSLKRTLATLLPSVVLLVLSACLVTTLGGEFIPELEEGAVAIGQMYLPGTSLDTVIGSTTALEKMLKTRFPDEVQASVSRIGRPEIATDPMQAFQADTLITLTPPAQWKKASRQSDLVPQMEKTLADLPAVRLSFSQPIKMRMMELIEGIGIRADLGIKLFGEDPAVLETKAQQIANVVRAVRGAEDVSVEATSGLPQMDLEIDRARASQLGVRVDEINQVVEAALGGRTVTQVNDGTKRIDVAVVLRGDIRTRPDLIAQLQVPTQSGGLIPLSAVCRFRQRQGPAQVSREDGQRRIVIQSNVRSRDLASFVEEVQARVASDVKLPPGYHTVYGGTYEKMQSGRARLAVIVPITFALILALLFVTFGSFYDALIVFVGVPLAASGGVIALFVRGMTLSISAFIGFIALAGVAVLNGVVMLHFIRDLFADHNDAGSAAKEGAIERLRPVLMTASVAGFGFLPMALATGAGAEVQKPLATVVIGGLVTSTFLTLMVLPVLWYQVKTRLQRRSQTSNPPSQWTQSTASPAPDQGDPEQTQPTVSSDSAQAPP